MMLKPISFMRGASAPDVTPPTINTLTWNSATQTLTLDVSDNVDTTFDIWWASYSGAEPSNAQVVAGTGGTILEAGNSQDTGGLTNQDLGFTAASDGSNNIKVVVRDQSGNEAASTVAALIDQTSPTLSSAVTNTAGDEVTLTYNENLTQGAAGTYTLGGVTGAPVASTGVSVLNNVITVTFPASTVANGDTVTITSVGGTLADGQGNAIAALSAQAVTNNVPASGSISIVGWKRFAEGAAGSNNLQSLDAPGSAEGTGDGGTIAQDDVVLAFTAVGSSASRTVGLSSTGYTSITSVAQSGSDQRAEAAAFWKAMGATPDAEIVQAYGGSSGDSHSSIAIVLRGADTTTPIDVAAVTGNGIDPGAITPANPNALILAFAATASDSAATLTASPANMTDVGAGSQNKTHDLGIRLAYHEWTSGAFDPSAFTRSPVNPGDGTEGEVYVVLAIRPA